MCHWLTLSKELQKVWGFEQRFTEGLTQWIMYRFLNELQNTFYFTWICRFKAISLCSSIARRELPTWHQSFRLTARSSRWLAPGIAVLLQRQKNTVTPGRQLQVRLAVSPRSYDWHVTLPRAWLPVHMPRQGLKFIPSAFSKKYFLICKYTHRARLTQASRCAAARTASVESPLELPAGQVGQIRAMLALAFTAQVLAFTGPVLGKANKSPD